MRNLGTVLCALFIGVCSVGISSMSMSGQLVKKSDVKSTTITFDYNGVSKTQKISCYRKVAGEVKKTTRGLVFTSYAALARKLKTDPRQQKKYLLVKTLVKEAGPVCKTLVSPTPTPGGAPTSPAQPTSRPTSTPASGNFDSNGNLTSQGKAAFGVPSSLSGNVTSGKSVWNAECLGCHSTEKTNKSYSFLKSAVEGSPMFITNLSSSQIANLTAYLNRFRP